MRYILCGTIYVIPLKSSLGSEAVNSNRHAIALVTGASRGIGWEISSLLAARGVDLVLVARDGDALRSLARDLQTMHHIRCHVFPADLTDPSSPAAISQYLRTEDLRVDILINNAGAGRWGEFAGMDPETSEMQIALNVGSLVHLTQLVLPGMLERRSGRILNVASTAGFAPGPFFAVYYATKAFVISFSEALSEELRTTGVTVSVLCPGPTRTQFFRRAGNEEINLTRGALMMEARKVAQVGLDGLFRGRPVIIPGLRNRLIVLLTRISPRSLVRKIVRILNERR